jgi:hypothetical protein
MPVVSICIATYNHAGFLPRCLDSILAQTFQDFEMVIVNDGSTDNTHQILMDYQERYPEKVRYFWHPGFANKGISATTNRAIQEARGKYIAFIGSDDTWHPEKLELQVALLEQHPEYGYVYSYAELIDEWDHVLPGLYGVDITHDSNPTGRMIIFCHQPAMTVVLKRNCLDEIEWFDESLVYGDWDLMLRLTALWPAGFIDRPLACYRLHGKNISKGIDPEVDLQRILQFTQAAMQKSVQVGGKLVEPRNQALLALQLTFLYYCLNDEPTALAYLNKAFALDESLAGDVQFLEKWVNEWKPEFYTPSLPNFGLWLIQNLSQWVSSEDLAQWTLRYLSLKETREFFIRRGIEQGKNGVPVEKILDDVPESVQLTTAWKKQVLKQIYPTLLFTAHRDHNDKERLRTLWIATIRHDPAWLLNRGVVSIGLQAFLK